MCFDVRHVARNDWRAQCRTSSRCFVCSFVRLLRLRNQQHWQCFHLGSWVCTAWKPPVFINHVVSMHKCKVYLSATKQKFQNVKKLCKKSKEPWATPITFGTIGPSGDHKFSSHLCTHAKCICLWQTDRQTDTHLMASLWQKQVSKRLVNFKKLCQEFGDCSPSYATARNCPHFINSSYQINQPVQLKVSHNRHCCADWERYRFPRFPQLGTEVQKKVSKKSFT